MEPIDSIKNDSHKQEYIKKVNELIYKSNNNYSNTKQLFVLTLCIVFLGCCARTFYDYIGWECYKGGQNMDTWWPWYVFSTYNRCANNRLSYSCIPDFYVFITF